MTLHKIATGESIHNPNWLVVTQLDDLCYSYKDFCNSIHHIDIYKHPDNTDVTCPNLCHSFYIFISNIECIPVEIVGNSPTSWEIFTYHCYFRINSLSNKEIRQHSGEHKYTKVQTHKWNKRVQKIRVEEITSRGFASSGHPQKKTF